MSTPPRTHAARRSLALASAGLLLLTGCGDQRSAAVRINDDTAAVVSALNAKDATRARAALRDLDADLAAAGRLDQLQAATVSELRAGVSRLVADLALLSPPTPSAPATQTATPVEGGSKRKHGKHGDD